MDMLPKRTRFHARAFMRAACAIFVVSFGFLILLLSPSLWFPKLFGQKINSSNIVHADYAPTTAEGVTTSQGGQGSEGTQGGCQGDGCQGA